jgi:hypothetical protein
MTLWKELITASNYTDRPYDYAKNQLAHWALGYLLAAVFSFVLFSTFGEFAYKGVLFGIMCLTFGLWEVYQWFRSGTTLWDHFEDWVFMAVYGSGSMVFLFHEVTPGLPYVWSSVYYGTPLVGLISVHLITGIVTRQINRKKDAR